MSRFGNAVLLLVSIVTATIPARSALGADAPAPLEGRPDNRVRFCGFGGDGASIDMLMAWWPNLEYCRAYDDGHIDFITDLGRDARTRGVRYSLQAAAPVMPKGYLDTHGNWSIDFLDRKPPQLGFGHPVADYCHPATIAAAKANIDVSRQVGANAFSMVDFVWPWVGGNWGYSKACVTAYRAALAETDGGLRIWTSDGEKVLTFWGYLGELSGVRLTPQDLGYKTWDEYEPVRSNQMGDHPTDLQRRNAFLFRGLYHYCWLRYAQEIGAYARSKGSELQASLNPENMANGTDLLTWGRLTSTGEPWMEQWGSPGTAIAGYHTYRYFTEPYRAKTKRLGLVAETGAAGGHPGDSGFGPARPHYWDPNSNYAITWAIAAAGHFDDREEDYIYASPQETLDPASPQADCWRGYVKGMDGFWQFALDAPQRPVAPILSIVNRAILHNNDNSEGTVQQKYNLAPPLDDLHIDFEQAYFPLSDSMLTGRKVLLFAPWEYPRDVLPRLNKWLTEDKARVIVTHSFVPSRPCKGLQVDAVPELDEAGAAESLGLKGLKVTNVRSGKINAIAPEWAGAFSIATGIELKLDRPLIACEGKPLVKLGDAPLVTLVQRPQGGSVIYLNFTPPERYETNNSDAARLLSAVMSAITRTAGITPMAEGAPNWACAKFDLSGGDAFMLLDRNGLKQSRFTEETPSYDPAGKYLVLLKPQTNYYIYDVLADTVATRGADGRGALEIFLSGRSIRLLYFFPVEQSPKLLFTTCERRDGRSRTEMPAKLFAHRAGKAVIAGIPKNANVFVDGQPAVTLDTALADGKTVLISKGDHTIEVR